MLVRNNNNNAALFILVVTLIALSWETVLGTAEELEQVLRMIHRLGDADDVFLYNNSLGTTAAAPKLLDKQRTLAAETDGCAVGSAFHIVSSDYPKSTGCYFNTPVENTTDGLFFTQTGVGPSETGEGLGQAVVFGSVKRVRSSSYSSSSDTVVDSSSSSSSFSNGLPSRFGILWRHFYVLKNSETPKATLSEILASSVPYGCNGYSPFLGMSHPTDVVQWFCREKPFVRSEIINDDVSTSDSSGSFSGSKPRPAFTIVSKEAFSLVCEAGCDVTATAGNQSDAADASNNKKEQNRLQVIRTEEVLDDGHANDTAGVSASVRLSPLRVVCIVAGAAAAAATMIAKIAALSSSTLHP